MQDLDEFCFDVATGLSQGRRERQEDAVIADFPLGAPFGFAVLSDGMGGHASGEIASGIVVTEVFSELKMQGDDPRVLEPAIGDTLKAAVGVANECIAICERENPATRGMGATLVAPILFSNRLYWISIGDSPLYLFRGEKLFRLNEDHSFAAQIDDLQARGVIPLEEALNHPDRSCLISVMSGAQIAQIDCRTEPMRLQEGDIVLAASDGVHALSEAEIAEVLRAQRDRPSNHIGTSLMEAVQSVGDPEQDNLSLCLIKVMRKGALHHAAPAPVEAPLEDAAPKPIQDLRSSEVVQIDRSARNGTVHTLVSLSRKVRKI